MKRHLGITFLFLISIYSFSYSQTFDEGVEQFENGNLEEAKSTFDALKNSDKDNPEIYYYLGRIEFDKDEYKRATNQFKKAADLDSGNSHYRMWLGHSYGRQAQNASVLKQAGLARNSRRNYERSIELDPRNIEARESAMEYYLQAPKFVGGGRGKAENQANEIEKLDLEAGIIAWGRVYTYYDEVEFAENHYKMAIDNHPELMVSYYQLYNFYFNRQDYSSAADIAIQQLQINDTTAAIYNNLGNAQQRDGLFDQAMENYYKTLELNEEFYNSWYQIGRLAAVSGEYLEEGKDHIERFIALDSEVGNGWLTWGYLRLGEIHEHMNEIEEAKSAYSAALDIDKDFDQAKEALADLD